MITDFEQYAAKFQEESLKALKHAQEANLAALQKTREMFCEVTAPSNIAELSFEYATKLLAMQKECVLAVADIFAPTQSGAKQTMPRGPQPSAGTATQKN